MTASLKRKVAVLAAAAGLSACTLYHAEPLPDHPDLVTGLDGLRISSADMPLPELLARQVDPAKPLDMDEVAMIAVARNPDLRTSRAKAHVTRAQAFDAGLLPNPQFNADYGVLASGPGTVASYTLGLMQDIMPFVTLSSRKDAAAAQVRGADLDLLWQEWQVVGQARLLTVRAVEYAKQRDLLDANRRLFRQRYEATEQAVRRGDQTLATLVSDLAALTGVETQLHDLDTLILGNRQDLNALLGLEPGARLALSPDAVLDDPDPARVRAELPELVKRRPDLLALRAGYEAQEETVYQAVLNQFPPFSLGGNRASDTSNVKTNTASLSIALPIFNRNQGVIGIEKANRETLKQDYQSRLDAAYAGVGQALEAIAQLREQYDSCAESLKALGEASRLSEQAFKSGGLDERTYADLAGALLARQIEALKLEQSLLEQKIALRILVGSDVPEKKEDQP